MLASKPSQVPVMYGAKSFYTITHRPHFKIAMTRAIRGFSLVQLCIAVGIISIVAVQSAGSFTPAIQRYSLKGAVQAVYFAMQYARSHSVIEQRSILVDIQSGDDWCIGLTDQGDCNCGVSASCTVNSVEYVASYQSFQFVSLDKSTFQNLNQTQFTPPRGLSTGFAGSLTFSAGAQSLKLLVSNAGRVRICSLTPPHSPYKAC